MSLFEKTVTLTYTELGKVCNAVNASNPNWEAAFWVACVGFAIFWFGTMWMCHQDQLHSKFLNEKKLTDEFLSWKRNRRLE